MTTRMTAASLALSGALIGMPLVGQAQTSGFIDNLPAMQPDPDRADATIWQSPDFRRSDYAKVVLEPVTLFIDPDSEYKGLNADELKRLADGFRKTVTQVLQPDIPVVDTAGKDVLHVRAALTDVRVRKKKPGPLSFTPIGMIVTAVEDAAGRVSVQKATLEVELLDSMTGKRLGVSVDHAPGKEKPDEEAVSWGQIKGTLEFYARRLKQRLTGGAGQ